MSRRPKIFVKAALKILGQEFVKRAHFRPSENLGKIFRQHFYPQKVKRNLVGKILGKIKISVQDFVPIRTALMGEKSCRWGNVMFGHGFD